MKLSLQKLQKFLMLETDRGFDNHAVMGGLERMLDLWKSEAQDDGLTESFIEVVSIGLNDYSNLSIEEREEILKDLLQRIEQMELSHSEDTISSEASPPLHEPTALNSPVTAIQGIGPRNAQSLSRLSIFSLRDMLYHFPRRYDDYSRLQPINRLKYGEEVTVIGTVQNITTRPIKSGKFSIVEAIVSDGSGSLRITWFNQTWIAKRLMKDAHIVFSGRVDQYLGRLVMNNPEWEHIDRQQLNTNRIVPVYPLTAQISQRWLRNQINQLVSFWAPRLPDPVPNKLLQSANLVGRTTALMQIHFPDSWEDLRAAQERLAFDEVFLLQLGVLRQKRSWQERTAKVFHFEDKWLDLQQERLSFPLTNAQKRVLSDIRHDLDNGRPMNRLIQGDVGSGKTVLAALAILMVNHHGAQTAIMAPTSILAEQHYRTMLDMLTDQSVSSTVARSINGDEISPMQKHEIRLMIGATPEEEKRRIRAGLASGYVKLVIGTHALIEDPVTFTNLQLVVVDEQHRFGVEQRAALRSKGDNPHLLVMTATPIPRSLALTIYGDLDLSVIDEMPPGRQPISTYLLKPQERERAYSLIRGQILQGHQAFIVYPLIEESENFTAKAAVDEFMHIKELFPEYQVGLLHGKMRPDEKEDVMVEFYKGNYQVLVSTSVIEVGVDIPNATVILIEGANHFGLAQLHQLRGRVGRSTDKSYCLLIPDSKDEVENERLLVMTSTNDGFVLAEHDLNQRGPGQFLGTRQSGYSELKLANLTNVHLIEKARRQAQIIFENDPDLNLPEHHLLASTLQLAWKSTNADIS